MVGYVDNIEQLSLNNKDFRRVLYTDANLQLVVMSIAPGDDIGAEVHHLDQFIRCEKGEGKAILNDEERLISDGMAVIVPSGVMHNIINTSSDAPLQLYTIYTPPNHRDGTIHHTKADAMADEEHFDGTSG